MNQILLAAVSICINGHIYPPPPPGMHYVIVKTLPDGNLFQHPLPEQHGDCIFAMGEVCLSDGNTTICTGKQPK